ncbi:3-deoxy-manno-octulosonate cytidylyltransferase [Pokkaliibacter sp. CJK22405]|uniref:3-deoxy-manno-octulosonate cytidylyltransferase n=1 Tax=Pokkaliibacter sp. CJK22405 TaxID=3384615 RepID=UPI003984971E
MSYTVVIPARYASSRLQGKPLLDIGGKPMLWHTWQRACESQAARVVIATDDQRIYDAATAFGAEVCMTADTHNSGTDRIQEVASQLGLSDDDVIVNVQGDEPLLPGVLIEQVAQLLVDNPQADMATLCEPLQDVDQLMNPSVVKVVMSANGLAQYFSRAPIPWHRDAFANGRPEVLPEGWDGYRHIGMYAYRVGLLNRFVSWPSAPTEQWESLEQLRVLWNGGKIQMAVASEVPAAGVDTPEDLERVRRMLSGS